MKRPVLYLAQLVMVGAIAGGHAAISVGAQSPRDDGKQHTSHSVLSDKPLDQPTRVAIDALLRRHDRPDEPGCAAGVYRDGAVLYSGAFGRADLSSGEKLTPGTAINIGSVAKQFTAATVLLLAKDGKLSLDDSIRTYLPELPDYSTPITIRQLLTHTSGIRDYRGLLNLAGHRNDEQVPVSRILSMIVRQQGLSFSPGEQYQYSNSNYFLAAVIVERVAGDPFSTFTRRRIFEPLGMKHARYKGDTAGLSPLAVHYASNDRAKFLPFAEHWQEIGGGDLYTTIGDLARWNGNFRMGEVGGRDLSRALETRGTLANGRLLKYALGLEHGTLRGHSTIGHTGGSGGSVSTLRRFPEAGLSIAILCNRADGPADALTAEIAALVLPLRAGAEIPAALATYAGRPNASPATWVGSYRASGSGNVVTVRTEGDSLTLGLGGGHFPLRSVGGNAYQLMGAPMDLFARFEKSSGSGTRQLVPVDSDDPPMLVFEPDNPTPAELARFAGEYHCPEVEATFRIRAEKGTLVANGPLETTMQLQPLDRGVFAAENLVFNFDRATGESSSGFRLDQWRARGMRCKRVVGSRTSP